MIKYSIIITTYNWPEALDLVLTGLTPQLQLNDDVEIVIADDGSTVTTKAVIDKYRNKHPVQIKHVWHEDLGFRRTMILNKAVVASSGDYLMFLDGDCVPFPDYIKMHKQLAQTKFFVAGNRVLLSKNFTAQIIEQPQLIKDIFSWNILGWLKAKLAKKVNKLLPFLRLNAQASWRYLQGSNWRYPKGCNLGMWRNDFIAVNGYDESFIGWGHEDSDLFVRLLHNGLKIKNGRFAIPVLHLWHRDADRTRGTGNYQMVLARAANPTFIQAKTGLNNHKSS